jgi:hypothetical protein
VTNGVSVLEKSIDDHDAIDCVDGIGDDVSGSSGSTILSLEYLARFLER